MKQQLWKAQIRIRVLSFMFVGMAVLISCTDNNNQIPESGSSTSEESVTKIWPYIDQSDQEISQNLVADNIYVVFDGSGSMFNAGCSNGQPKYAAAQTALKVFSKIVPADTNLGFMAFDSNGIGERVPLGLKNRAEFTKQVNSVSISGGTPLKSAMKIAYDNLTKQAKKQLGYGRYQLVVVTDGQANDDEDPYQLVSEITNSSPVEVHTIGFCISENHSLNIPGITVYKSAMNTKALQQGLKSTLAESPTFVAQFN